MRLPLFRCGRTAAALLLAAIGLATGNPKPARIPKEVQTVLGEIAPANLRGDLSFLSSDSLKGRKTPSPELEISAEFIASRFRAAGLEPSVNGSYFQDADLTEATTDSAKKYHFTVAPGPVKGRNVIGILRGSDSELRETYVIVSAHYDHIGTLETSKGLTNQTAPVGSDNIFNGADDDGSGTVAVIALAEAFGNLRIKPRRSIVFIAFCGEELGLLGSAYYTDHPVVPLRNTIANLNLEQVGRTDGDVPKGAVSLTGFNYTDMAALFNAVSVQAGLKITENPVANKYFAASDNYNFARYGVPANTLTSAFEFPDYHGLKDEWTKIDYDSLSRITRLSGAVLWLLADRREPLHWNTKEPKTKKYREAADALYHPAPKASL